MNEDDFAVERQFKELGLRNRVSLVANVGVALVVIFASILLGVLYVYAAFVSKLLPDTGIFLFDWIKQDTYFCYLIPLALPTSYVFIYINWLSLRVFENNE